MGGYRPPLLYTADPELRKKRLNAELANGRLAMMAIIGMFFQDGLTGSAWGDWAFYTESPLRAFEDELGVQAPVGFFDPLGFTADGDVKSFTRRRSVEIKHGRVCMLATMGYITPEITGKFGGYLSPSMGVRFEDIPNGLGAISKVPLLGWMQILFYGLFCENKAGYQRDVDTGEPGNMRWKPPLLVSSDPEVRKRRLNAELANGRLAMVAIIGMFFQDGLTGSAWGDWANYTASPLRAFESELGVQAPVGFWDPFGMTKDGDVEAFKRRRATELKNGRVAMLACMGYIAPTAGPHFGGYLSPSANLSFEDIPNGLRAVSEVPANGWLQIFLFIGLVEKAFFVHDPKRPPGDFEKAGVLGVPNGSSMPDGPAKTRKLNAELANGRLAMMAIVGMWFQDGLTGSAWGDWSLYHDAPPAAFESELGVQAPVGFWDPLGMSKDGDVDVFRRRREAEVKHGRVAMFATIGWIVPEYFRFPGLLCPSKSLAFADVPNGLDAISSVPALGWVQWFLFCGLIDFGLYRADPKRDPGDYANGGILGVPNASGPMSDKELRSRKLNSELANGRLAMVAIMGMMFQSGTVGTSGPAMWGF